MKVKREANELKVGILVLLGILALVYMSLRVSKTERIKGDVYYVLFDNVSGLAKGAPVEVAGVIIGKVDGIYLEGNRAKVKLVISKDVRLFANASATLRTHGALGDKFVQLDPGTPDNPTLISGAIISNTQATPDLDQLFLSLKQTAEEFAGMGGALKELVGSEETRKALKELVLNLRDSSKDLKSFITHNREKAEKALDNIYTFSENLNSIASQASTGLEKFQSTLSFIEEVSQKVASENNTIGKLLSDRELYDELNETLKQFRSMAEKVNQGDGTFGKLIADDSLYRQAEHTLKRIERAAEGIEEQAPLTVLSTLMGLLF